jgi:methylated-DNA-[protein]-cysteine S-methyltransferase
VVQHFRVNVDSPVGVWGVEGTSSVITRIYMPSEFAPPSRGATPKPVQNARHQLVEYFAQKRKQFHIELEHVPATPFQLEVWEALNDIPYGEVRTYADVAFAIGRPRAMRAIGNANNVNPWPVIIPCHRVVARHGIGGYGGGTEVKRFLLGLEGVNYD